MQRRRSRYQIMQELRIYFELKDALLAKKAKKPLYDQTIEMVCQGKRHKIQLRFPGRISLLNHGSKAGEALLIKLGGDKPACIKFLEDWKRDPSIVCSSRPLVKKLKLASDDLSSKRRSATMTNEEDYLMRSLRSRLDSRVVSIFSNLRERIIKQFTTKEEQERQSSYSYSRYHITNQPKEDNRIIVPTIKFVKYEDRLNNPLTKKEDKSDETETS